MQVALARHIRWARLEEARLGSVDAGQGSCGWLPSTQSVYAARCASGLDADNGVQGRWLPLLVPRPRGGQRVRRRLSIVGNLVRLCCSTARLSAVRLSSSWPIHRIRRTADPSTHRSTTTTHPHTLAELRWPAPPRTPVRQRGATRLCPSPASFPITLSSLTKTNCAQATRNR